MRNVSNWLYFIRYNNHILVQGIRTARPQDKSPPVKPKTTRPKFRTTRHHSRQLAPNIKTTCSQYSCAYYDKIYNENLIFSLIYHNAIYILQVLFQFLIDFYLKFYRISKLSITVLLEQFYSNASIISEGCMYSD